MYSKQSYNYGRHGSKRKLKSIPVIITCDINIGRYLFFTI